MKKIICAFLVFAVLFSLCACSASEPVRNLNELFMSAVYEDWDSVSAEKDTTLGSAYKNYFDTLSEKQKKAYNHILSGIMTAEDVFPEKIEVPLMESSELTEVYEAVNYDNPEIMCFGKGASIITEGELCFFKPEYTMIPEEMRTRIQAVSEKADEICAEFAAITPDFNKELDIHDYIVENCEYNMDADDAGSVYGCLIMGCASCEGYAKATKYLLEKAGVECYNILGEAENQQGENESHMWNVVNIGGKFYHLDTTWDDPVEAVRGVSHIYFNLTENEIKADHSGFSSDFVCDSTEENFFVRAGCLFSSADYYSRIDMQNIIISRLDSGTDCVEFRFASKEAFENALYTLITASGAYEIQNNIKYRRPDLKMADEIKYSKNEKYNVIEFMF